MLIDASPKHHQAGSPQTLQTLPRKSEQSGLTVGLMTEGLDFRGRPTSRRGRGSARLAIFKAINSLINCLSPIPWID